jgi:GTP-binding protein of the ras superfamily involved in termination of M-phase
LFAHTLDMRFSLSRRSSSSTAEASSAAARRSSEPKAPPVRTPALVKVALLGDSQVGKTCLMAQYVEGTFDETQLHTQGVNFMEKSVALDDQEVTFSIWDIGGHADSESMLPLVCNDAAAVLLMFDLSRPETLDSVREWHRKARALNRCAVPFLIGCKYDALLEVPTDEHAHICRAARQFAAAISAPLIFCAPSVPINVANVFKVSGTRPWLPAW